MDKVEQRAWELLEAECGKPLPFDVPVHAALSAIRAALAQQPAAEPRSTHRVWRRNDWLPCYCEATSDHHIGCEQQPEEQGGGEVVQRLRGVLQHAKMGNSYLISQDLIHKAIGAITAPPSAPVGVDASGSRAWMAEVCRAAALSLAAHGVRNDQLSKVADWIARQPAAVDEGFVSRLAEALTDQDWDVDPDGDGSGIAQLRAAVVAAQQQGGRADG